MHIPGDVADVAARLRAAGCVWADDEAALLVAHVDEQVRAGVRGAGPDALEALAARRCAGEPLEHLLGWAEFAGVRVSVAPGVFVPRHRSEALVDVAVPLLVRAGMRRQADDHPAVLVDLCCGTGALGLATVLRAGVPVEWHAADLDPAAVACARSTLTSNAGGVPRAGSRRAGPPPQVWAGDLFDALPTSLRGRIDVLIANVPYVPRDAIALLPPEFRDHEHRLALDGGADGLDVARRVLASAGEWLAPAGALLMEASAAQAAVVVQGSPSATSRRRLRVEAVVDAERETSVIVAARD